ncbi:MAG: GTPase Era, partial [Deltaproteobacteria bacterium]|nr:GTPase Era [Deltaproteobacteria bacterium]
MKAFKAGVVAIVGLPNAGKSTLTNALAGLKISIVTPKPQTTRSRIQAVITRDDAQVVLVDTPGLTRGHDALRRALYQTAAHAARESDVALLLVEVSGGAPLEATAREALDVARQGGRPVVVALNKIDKLARKEVLLPWIAAYAALPGVAAVVPISALRADGLQELVDEIVTRLPESPPLFPPDTVTDQIERVLCAELVREQLYLQLHQELPYSSAVVIDEFEDGRPSGLCRLAGRIVVERESQKGIVVGKGGKQIKAVSERARAEIEKLLGARV